MRKVASSLTPERMGAALELARLPQSVRGFGHVKERNHHAAVQKQARLLAAFTSGGDTADAPTAQAA
jgi:indolepyruvate ferredoxin oxidoreductase